MGKSKLNKGGLFKSRVWFYYAVSDGSKIVCTNRDGVKGFKGNVIRNSFKMTYINLYINGMLQPKLIIEFEKES